MRDKYGYSLVDNRKHAWSSVGIEFENRVQYQSEDDAPNLVSLRFSHFYFQLSSPVETPEREYSIPMFEILMKNDVHHTHTH